MLYIASKNEIYYFLTTTPYGRWSAFENAAKISGALPCLWNIQLPQERSKFQSQNLHWLGMLSCPQYLIVWGLNMQHYSSQIIKRERCFFHWNCSSINWNWKKLVSNEAAVIWAFLVQESALATLDWQSLEPINMP